MTPLAQRLGLTVLLAVSVASLVLSTFMIFTLRLLAASVAEVCPPGGGCEIPSWVGGINIAEKEWWWARIKEQRYIQITTRWLPLTYACIGYSALALLYIALYGYTHTVSRAKTKWTAVGYDVVLQLGFGACGIVIAALHLLVEWMYGRFFWNHLQQKTNWSRYSENIFAPRVCGDLGTYCAMGTLIALGALFVLAAVAQLYYVVHRRASWSDSLVSIDKLRAESGRKVTDSSGSQDSSNGQSEESHLRTHRTPNRYESRQFQDFVVPRTQPSPWQSSSPCKSPRFSVHSTSSPPTGTTGRVTHLEEGTSADANTLPSASNRRTYYPQTTLSSASAGNKRLSTGSLGSPHHLRASVYRSIPKTPSPLSRATSYQAVTEAAETTDAVTPLGFLSLSPRASPERPSNSCANSLSVHAAGPTPSPIGDLPISSSSSGSSLPTAFETASDSSTIRGRSRPTSQYSRNSGGPSAFAVFAALEELQAALAAPHPTPEVIRNLQARIAHLHSLAYPDGTLPPTPPTNRHSIASLPNQSRRSSHPARRSMI